MKKRLLTVGLMLLGFVGFSQTYLSENFSTASGTTPPAGWANVDSAASGEIWTFNNPGGRTLNSPIANTAAIFDSDFNGSGSAEDAYLESDTFNAFGASLVLLTFDHYFQSGFGGSATIEAFNGTSWDSLTTYSAVSTANPQTDTIDITGSVSATTSGRVRFRWQGNYSWYWILDNVKVFSPSANDVGVTAVIDPISSTALTAAELITVEVRNFGSTAATNVPVSFILDGGTPVNESIAVPIPVSGSIVYSFTATGDFSAPGAHTLVSYTGLAGDGDLGNDTLRKIITKFTGITSFPYFENFENGDGQWISGGTNSSWQFGNPNNTEINAAGSGDSAWVTNLSGPYNVLESSFVESQVFDFTSLTAPVFSAKVYWTSENSWDGTVLQSSIDGGATWQKVGAFGDPNNWYTDNTINGLSAALEPSGEGWTGTGTNNGSKEWVTAKHDLTGLGGLPSVKLRFAFGSDGSVTGEGFGFDDVTVYDTPAIDAELLSIVDPNSGCGLGNESVSVAVVNAGLNSISNFPVSIQVNNGTPLTENITTTILPLDTFLYTFTGTVNLGTIGTYSLKAYTGITGDGLNSNDTALKTVTAIPTISTFPYTESFETGNGGWISSGNLNSWALGAPSGTVIDTAFNGTQAWVTNLSGVYNNNEASFVTSACFDFTSLTSPIISFNIWYEASTSNDGALLQASIDGGATWNTVGAFGDPNNWYNDNSIFGLNAIDPNQQGWTGNGTAGSNGWIASRRSLPSLGGEPSVRFRFAFGADGFTQNEGFAFDNISIIETPSSDAGLVEIVDPTSGCGLTNAETVTVKVVNDGAVNLTSTPVHMQVNGMLMLSDTITATILPGDTLVYTFNGTVDLSTVGNYNLKAYSGLIGDVLSANDTTLKTIINIPIFNSFPYAEGFENGNAGWTSGGTNNSWALGAPANTVINSAAGGTAAWVTNLSGNYNPSEASFVVSPCFDFSGLIAPIVSLDVFWNSEFSWDGAALQTSIDGGTTWQIVGALGDPDNWYTDNTINGLVNTLEPSGQGWTGRASTTNGSNGWVNARHTLTGLGGVGGVLFRIAFGADGSVHDEGFAFDNFQVFESPAIDIAANIVTRPLVACGLSATETIAVELENKGTDTLTNFPLYYSINGTPINSPETFTDTILPGAKAVYEYTTPANLAAITTYTIRAYAAITGDFDITNDTAAVTLTNIAPLSNPYTEGYDLLADGAIDFSPIRWNAVNSGTFRWQAETSTTSSTATGPTGDRSGSGTYIYSEASSGTTGDTIYLESSCIDITPVNGVNSSTRLDYWYHMYGADIIALGLEIDSAGSWTLIDTIIGQQQTANADTFRLRSLDLSAYQAQGVTSFRFWTVKGASFNGDVSIDDFRIYDTVGVNLSVDSITSPVSNCGLGANANVEVSISNKGLSSVSNFPITYVLNNGTPVTDTVRSTIIPGSSLSYQFTTTVNLQTVGNYDLTVYAAVTGDGDPLNDTVSTSIVSGFAQILDNNSTFYANDFEGATNNWVTYGTNNSWAIGTPSSFYINGPYNGSNAYVTAPAGNHNANEVSYIETPCYDLSYFNSSDLFDMNFFMLFKSEVGQDQLWMELTTNNGTTWNKVLPDVSSINFYNNTTDNVWEGFSTGGVGSYIPVINSITGIGGLSQVKFRFAFVSNGTIENDGFAIDAFRLETPLFTGVEANALNGASFSVFPNPTKDLVTIGFDNVNEGQYNLSIVDVKGQVVNNQLFTVTSTNSKKVIDLSSVERGVYFVRIVSGETSVTKKLIVR